jgi:hypothetical protein
MRRHRSVPVPDEHRWDIEGEPGVLAGRDVEAEVAELKARGVLFEEYDMPGVEMRSGIAVAGGAKTAWFKDTEGNILAISQRL